MFCFDFKLNLATFTHSVKLKFLHKMYTLVFRDGVQRIFGKEPVLVFKNNI